MSRTQGYEWTEKFKNGVTSVEDSPRPGPAFTAVNGRQHCGRGERGMGKLARHSQGSDISIGH